MFHRPDECRSGVHGIIHFCPESDTRRVFRLAISLPEASMALLTLGMCQNEHGPIGHRVTPPRPVGIQNTNDSGIIFSACNQKVERPQIAMQQAWDLNFIQLLRMSPNQFQDISKMWHLKLILLRGVKRTFQAIADCLTPAGELKTGTGQSECLAMHIMNELQDLPKLIP